MHHESLISRLRRAQSYLALLLMTARITITTLAHRHIRDVNDEGSETTEKAVLTAVVLGLALGLGAAIAAVVHRYQGQIR